MYIYEYCSLSAQSRQYQKEARSRDYALLLFQMTSRVLYSAQYRRLQCTLHAFEQFGTLYMHNHEDKYSNRLGFEPGTLRLQTPVDTNKPSGPACKILYQVDNHEVDCTCLKTSPFILYKYKSA